MCVSSSAVCDVVCLSYETLREALAGTHEAAYRLCNAVHSMLDLYAEFTSSRHHEQISSLPLVAGELLTAHKTVLLVLLKCFTSNGFAAYIFISASAWQSYALWTRFRGMLLV